VDPQFSLYPIERNTVPEIDEICIKNTKSDFTAAGNIQLVSQNYSLGLSKTVSGSYVNNLDIPTGLMPGNFGVRVLDNMMPTNLSDVYRDRQNTNVG
jgi:hypothetical protein